MSRPLTATTTPDDHRRALRLLVAWATGDKLALDVVLTEVMRDNTGTPGLVFSLAEFTTEIGTQGSPDYVEQLRQLLLHDAANDDDQTGEDT